MDTTCIQHGSLKEIHMKNLVTDSTPQLSGSGSKSAPYRPTETAVRAKSEQTRVTPTETPAAVVGQSYRFDVMGRPDNGGFDVLGRSDLGSFDVLGRSDLGGFDVLAGPALGGFDVLGRSDLGGFDVLGYKR
jgi:hypothetical protein